MGLVRHETNQKLLELEHERDKNGFGQFARNLAPGRTTLRVMPAYSDKGVWFHKVEEHFIQAKQRSIVCCEDAYGRCPICEKCAELDAAGDEAGAKQYKPTVKFLVNAIILADPTNKVSAKDGVKVVRIGNTIKKELVALDNDRASGYGNIVAYDNGFNLNVDRTGSGLKTEYSVRVIPTRVDIVKQLTEEGIDVTTFQLNNLEAILVPKTYEETKMEFEGMFSDEPQEAVPVATPVPRQAPDAAPTLPAPAAPPVNTMKTFVPPTIGQKVAGVTIPPPPMLGKKA
jgi:hypothetical protein